MHRRPFRAFLLAAVTTLTAASGNEITWALEKERASAATTRPARSDHVKVCQVGYLPGETKFAIVTAQPVGAAVVRNDVDGSVVLRCTAGPAAKDPDTGDTTRSVDFSSLTQARTYYLDVPGVGASDPFRVGDDVFARPFRLAMRSFTGQRCGTSVSLAPDFPQFAYAACHLADAQFHPSSGKQGTMPCTGGWHDAGDYGRYVVNSGITTATLLYAYELNAAKLSALPLDLPESGGRIPDMLAEIKWNLDWMLKMQDADGGVWHKLTTAGFPGFIMPADDKGPLLVIGNGSAPFKTTTATADLAAVCAIAARAYRPFDSAYADRCLAAAERAWAWTVEHSNVLFTKNPEGVHTGGYEDRKADDERLWAAAELFRSTGRAAYHDYFLAHYAKSKLSVDVAPGWPEVGPLALFSYALSGHAKADPKALAWIRADAIAAADGIAARSRTNPYRIPLRGREYYWGSNAVAANYGVMLVLANRIQPRAEYVNAAQDVLHYLLGRNTFNTSFVTQVGSRWPMKPHHRPSAADKIAQPWPGLLVGGPNAERKSPPARQWVDDEASYTTNEVAINWNAPLVFLLAEALPNPPGRPNRE